MMKNIIFFILVAISPAIRSYAQDRKVILAVGVSNFDNMEKFGLEKIFYPISDAKKVFDHFKGIGFDGILLENPTYSEVVDALDRLNKIVSDSDDQLLLYFSSHGIRRFESIGISQYVLMKDSNPDNLPHTSVSLKMLENYLEAIPTQKKASIVAACKSGKMNFSGIKGGRGNSDASLSFLMLSATDEFGYAREIDEIGDLYTFNLLESMNRESDGTLLGAHLNATKLTMAATNNQQVPTITGIIKGVDKFFVSSAKNNIETTTVRVLPSHKSDKILISGVQLKGGEKTNFTSGGTRNLEIYNEDGSLALRKNIQLESGKEYILSGLLEGPNANSISFISNTYFFNTNSESFPSLVTGFGLGYHQKVDSIEFSIGYINYSKDEKIKYDVGSYKTNWKANEIYFHSKYSIPLHSTTGFDSMVCFGGRVSSYYLVKRVLDDNAFNNNSNGLVSSFEIDGGYALTFKKVSLAAKIGYGLHSNFTGLNIKAVSIGLHGTLYSW